MSGYQRSSGTAGAVAAALAVLAVLAVAAAGVTAGVVATGSSEADAPPPSSTDGSSTGGEPEDDEPATFFPDGQVIVGDRRDNADLEVPSVDEGWEVETAGSIRGYEVELPSGDFARVAVTGPAVWKVVQCRRDGFEVDAPRAFTGFTAPSEDDGRPEPARRANDETVDRWLDVLEAIPGGSQRELERTTTTISDGTPARLTRILSLPADGAEPGRCGDKAVELSFLSFDTGDYSANIVVSRLVAEDGSDLPGALSADVVQQVLASPRLQDVS
ncbi:hypothetical protein [Nocardioides sp. CFH 31398]|uniref:hypothetical protein n=1 Tax=Nocardioides sp. CFH 31398 TaxID=2919579 RepID=UPI001F05F646|nr:hypothetical protein [Nocardioides sp. CFH 31398]MCH1866250.1 hypothetical protein [Nocardioides sp. CFH 31398]